MIRCSYIDNLTLDSSYCTNFDDGRPGLVEYFVRNQSETLGLYVAEKFVYKNGNLIEKYENSWIILIKTINF